MAKLNFTPRAKKAISIAKAECKKRGYDEAGLKHLFYGILDTDSGTSREFFEFLGLDSKLLLTKISDILGVLGKKISEVKESADFKNTLELSLSLAGKHGHKYVGAEHILFAMLEYPENQEIRNYLISEGVTNKDIDECIDFVFCDKTAAVSRASDGTERKKDSKQKQDSSSTNKFLNTYCRNLNEAAKTQSIAPYIGGEPKIAEICEVLGKAKKNSPIILGESGTGKTHLVQELALNIAFMKNAESLFGSTIYSLDLGSLIAGTKYRGEFEQRLQGIINELKTDRNNILFIDEIHNVLGAGSAEGAMDAANILKPYLSNGEITIIGATTLDEYKKTIERDEALNRRFHPVRLDKVNKDACRTILHGVRSYYESFHNVEYSNENIEDILNICEKYIPYKNFPDKAIDLMDYSGAYVKIQSVTRPKSFHKLEAELEKLLEQIKEASDSDNKPRLKSLDRDYEAKFNKYKKEITEWSESTFSHKFKIQRNALLKVTEKFTKIPTKDIEPDSRKKILQLREILSRKIIDQNLESMTDAIVRNYAGIKFSNRPIGSFLLLGPSGCGKTETAKTIAEEVFGGRDKMFSFDMSEYMDKINVSRLIGAAPGYVGYEEGGALTEKVKRNPSCVLLFDEIEKAHPDVVQILLQVLEEGRLTDSFGTAVDFSNTIIIITGNVGSEAFEKDNVVGFMPTPSSKLQEDRIKEACKAQFRPEFINRLDEVVIFKPLSENSIEKIAELELSKLSENLKNKGYKVRFTDSVTKFAAKSGTDAKFGARPLRRFIDKNILNQLSTWVLQDEITESFGYVVSYVGEKLRLKLEKV